MYPTQSSPYSLKALTEIPFNTLYSTFMVEFDNYYIPMACPEDILRKIFSKNGVDLSMSIGVFDNEHLVGFTCIAIDHFNGEFVAYNNATGIIPEHRRKGLFKQMMEFLLPKLREKGCSKVILHVLEQNIPAINAYKKIGFSFNRKELCFRLNMANLRLPEIHRDDIIVKESNVKFIEKYGKFWDWIPSWDDLTNSVLRIQDPVDVLVAYIGEDCVGYIVFYPLFLQILQIFVDNKTRRQKVGTTLIKCLFEKHSQLPGVNYMGVPEGSSTVTLLESLGFEVFITQFEMTMKL